MKKNFFSLISVVFLSAIAAGQTTVSLTTKSDDGRLTLSQQGASYFAKLSLDCANKPYPHYYHERLQKPEDLKPPDKLWPSFYGCYDWHSGVHNHWALVKLLKAYPTIPEAKQIKEKLEKSFNAENIKAEVAYFKSHENESFEFPYGTSWLLKVAEELIKWNDPLAKKWLTNLALLTDYLSERYAKVWPDMEEPRFSGDHYSSALGLSFAYDYAIAAKKADLAKMLKGKGLEFYKPIKKFPMQKEPFGYDFMSAGLLIVDFYRKISTAEEFHTWLKEFNPDLFTISGITRSLKITKLEKHDEFESHFDGFHLNRIWCLNGAMQSLPANALSQEIKDAWVQAQNDMWDYAQESIGKGNYDIDHWLSSFSVYALEGHK
jgi:hypothetical protein